MISIAVGLVISGYLTYVKVSSVPILCVEAEAFNCAAVEQSQWASLLGIPVSLLGLLGYTVLGILFALDIRFPSHHLLITLLIFTVTLMAWLFSMWLVYVQAAILQTFCQWCLSHELNITILFALVIYRIKHALQ
jgi:uncharacterized membrane protein